MGNSPSAVSQRIEHGSKTGVCSLRELKLERVSTEKLRYPRVTNFCVSQYVKTILRYTVCNIYG